jgi:hypothetical protein
MDKLWAQEVLTWNGVTPALCGANTVDRCMAPSDILWYVPHTTPCKALCAAPCTLLCAVWRTLPVQYRVQYVYSTAYSTVYEGYRTWYNVQHTVCREQSGLPSISLHITAWKDCHTTHPPTVRSASYLQVKSTLLSTTTHDVVSCLCAN